MSQQRGDPIDTPSTGVTLGVLFFCLALGISVIVEWALFGGNLLREGVVSGVILGTVFGVLIYVLTES